MEFTGERYIPGQGSSELQTEHEHRYYAVAPLLSGKTVLDAACGSGYGSEIISRYAKTVVGLDISSEAIDYARESYTTVDFRQASIDKLPFEDTSFDAIVSFETIEHVDENTQRQFLEEITRVLKTDGTLIMSTVNKEVYSDHQTQKNDYHVNEFYLHEFKELLESHFSTVQLYIQSFGVYSAILKENDRDVKLLGDFTGSSGNKGMYVVAICTNGNEMIDLSSMLYYCQNYEVYYSDGVFWKQRYSELNTEYTERTRWALELDNMLQEREHLLANEREKALSSEALSKELKSSLILSQQELHNAKGHIELLLKSDRELDTLKATRFYRFYTFPKRVLFPPSSRRRFIGRMMKFTITHPIGTLKKLKPSRIKNLISILIKGEITRADEVLTHIEYENLSLDKKIIITQVAEREKYESLTLPEFKSPLVSIIIPVYNEFAYTFECVNAICNFTQIPYEVIIADDCSTDITKGTEDIIKNVTHIRNKENIRFLRNCNNAAKHAQGQYILLLNNDTQVQPGWLEPLVELMENDSSIGLVGSKLVYPDGRLQEAGGIVWKDGSAWNYGRYDNPEKPDYNYVKDVDYISGAAIMVRKAIWEELGGFDELYSPAYCEDSDLAFSIREKGYRTVYQPKSVVVHFEGVSHGTDTSTGQKQYQTDNMKKFYDRWKEDLTKDHLPNGDSVFQARDRSRYKKTVLFIDHYVPMFDKDAGSRNTYGYVKLFIEKGYHVIFLGDNFYPHEPYTEILQQFGVFVIYGSWYQSNWKSWIKENAEHIDFVYLNRPHISEKYIDFLREHTNAKLIYHGHDLHFMRIRAQYEIEKDEKLLVEAKDWEEREKRLFEKSDVILTLSDKEKSIISGMVSEKKIILLPMYYYDSFPDIKPFSEREYLLFVGGFAHIPNVDALFWFANEVMPLLPSSSRLIVAGSNPPDSILSLKSDMIDIKGYVTDEELDELYANARVTVIPLRFGAGVKGKTLEAMHNLVPVVSTSFGIEGIPIEDIIRPYDDADAFACEVMRFIKSEDACISAAKSYEQWIIKWFSPERAVKTVEEMTNC